MTAHSRIVLVMLAVLAVIGLAACGSGDDSDSGGPGDSGFTHPNGAGPVAGEMPDVSVREALSRIYTWQPAVEANSGEAMRKALPWLTGEMAQAARKPDDSGMRPMRQWAQWKDEKSVITASTQVVPVYDDPTDKTVQRRATVLQQIQRADGSVDAFSLMTYEVDVALGADNCWRVWRIQILDSQPLSDGVSQ